MDRVTLPDGVPSGNMFKELYGIDVNAHVEKKGELRYLSWAWAVASLCEKHPDATWRFKNFSGEQEYGSGQCYQVLPDHTAMVWCELTVNKVTREMWLPVMDNRNKPIENPNAFQVNTAMMRCLTKAIAVFGLGLYIYAGEDLPRSVDDTLQGLIHDMGAAIDINELNETIIVVKAFIADYPKKREELLAAYEAAKTRMMKGKPTAVAGKGVAGLKQQLQTSTNDEKHEPPGAA